MIYAPTNAAESDIPSDIAAQAAAVRPMFGIGKVAIGVMTAPHTTRCFWAIRVQVGRDVPGAERMDDGTTFRPVGGFVAAR